MDNRITYEQILRELQASGQLQPQRPAQPLPSPPPPPRDMLAPETIIGQRSELNRAFTPYGAMANPETIMAQQGRAPKPGLLQLLMSLMK